MSLRCVLVNIHQPQKSNTIFFKKLQKYESLLWFLKVFSSVQIEIPHFQDFDIEKIQCIWHYCFACVIKLLKAIITYVKCVLIVESKQLSSMNCDQQNIILMFNFKKAQ